MEKAFVFKDSTLFSQSNRWAISLSYKKRNGTKTYVAQNNSDPVWNAAITALNKRLPEIVYFPTFLFDVPDRIYLEEWDEEPVQNSYYRKVFNDVLKAVDPAYSIDKHIVKRVRDAAQASAAESFFRSLLGADIDGNIDTVVREVSNKASNVIIGAWDDIFGRKLVNKRVEFAWDFNPNNNNAVYVELFIIDGQ